MQESNLEGVTTDFVAFVLKNFPDHRFPSNTEYSLMLALASYANRNTGKCFPGEKKILARSHLTDDRALKKAREGLKAKGLIDYSGEPKPGLSYDYKLKFLSGFGVYKDDILPQKVVENSNPPQICTEPPSNLRSTPLKSVPLTINKQIDNNILPEKVEKGISPQIQFFVDLAEQYVGHPLIAAETRLLTDAICGRRPDLICKKFEEMLNGKERGFYGPDKQNCKYLCGALRNVALMNDTTVSLQVEPSPILEEYNKRFD